jgi:PAS domain S-box-containing protein
MSPGRRVALLVLLTAVYFIAGRFGLSLAYVHQSATAVWPPTGIAIAAGLLAGAGRGGVWPAVLLGAFLVNLSISGAVLASLLIAGGNTAEMLIAVWLVRRFAGGAAVFRQTSGVLLFAASVMAAAAVAATVGVAALILDGRTPLPAPAMVWITWWAGDVAGALLVASPIVTWATVPSVRSGSAAVLEATLLIATIFAASYWVFGPTIPGGRAYPLMFVVLPFQLWGALRFGSRGAATAVLVTAAIATAGTLEGYGPFARVSRNESLLLLQAYLCVKMVVLLSLAAEGEGRQAVERAMRQLNEELVRRVEARTEELQRLHGRLVEAQSVAHIGSWEWDVGADTIWWSDEMYRVYGLQVGSPVSYDRFISMVHPDDRARVQEIVGRSAETGEAFTFEHRALTPDGHVRVLHSRGRVVTDAQGRATRMLGVGHDVTDLKRAEEERLELVREQAARREAEEASRMKDHFLATLSHELRTPMNAILGWAQMLKDHAPDDALRQRAVDAIHRNVKVQAQLVSDILDVARIRSGTLSVDARPVAAGAVVAAALDILRPMIEAKQLEVTVRVRADAAVMADAHRLQQVFWNVLSNATKFAPPGGHIVVHAAARGDAIEFAVEDDGPGIEESFLPHVFDQFRQADSSNTREHGGLGLGLAISRNLVELHGGTISAANRPQGGAVFTIRIPAAKLERSTV